MRSLNNTPNTQLVTAYDPENDTVAQLSVFGGTLATS